MLSRSPERREDVTYAGNYLVFGHGPHYCVGKEYAINHLITFLAILSTSLDWTRFRCAWVVGAWARPLDWLVCVARSCTSSTRPPAVSLAIPASPACWPDQA